MWHTLLQVWAPVYSAAQTLGKLLAVTICFQPAAWAANFWKRRQLLGKVPDAGPSALTHNSHSLIIASTGVLGCYSNFLQACIQMHHFNKRVGAQHLPAPHSQKACPFVLRLTWSPNAVHNHLEISCVPLCYTSQIRALVSGTVCSQLRRINLYYTACQPHLNYFSHLLLYMGPLGNDGNIFGGFVCLLF